jgi:curved DNA-binding protein
MRNYYKVLGLLEVATTEEIRRAYRILARRYHPDLSSASDATERFAEIAEAYNVLNDEKKRKLYDLARETERTREIHAQYRKVQEDRDARAAGSAYAAASQQYQRQRETAETPRFDKNPGIFDFAVERMLLKLNQLKLIGGELLKSVKTQVTPPQKKSERKGEHVSRVSIVEVSISVEESIRGARKKIEITEPEGIRRVSVLVPNGVRDGSIIRMRDNRKDSREELVLIIRLAAHPFLTIKPKGLIAEIPISVKEALHGAQIRVPGLEDQIMIRVPSGSQSGTELRLKGQGIPNPNGNRGDYFIRLLIKLPEPPEAPGLLERAEQLSQYYVGDVRTDLPRTIIGN